MRSKWFWKALLLGAVVLGFAAWQGHALQLRADAVPSAPTTAAFVSPLPTPSVVPTPVPIPSPQNVAALQYVAQHHGIPLENLEIGQMHRRDYLALDRHYNAYTILERGASRAFRLMIDLSDDSITEDIGAVERADAQAHQKRYGKFDRPLYERLQTASERDRLPVAIWVGGVRGRSEEELLQALADHYPEVQEALARHALFLDLSDPDLVRRVKQEYEQLKRDDIAARIRPLVAHLESQAVPVQIYSLLPSVMVMLTKSALPALAQREDVEALYLVEGVAEPALDAAIPTDRVALLWTALGINGVAEPVIPQTIAIVEHGNVALDNTFLHQSGTRLLADNGDQDHTTAVASAVANFHGAYRGMAPGAIILSAGENGTEPYQHFALNWALDQGAMIANLSECQYNNTPDLDWLDRAFDYTARTRHAIITTAAGNHRQEYICSPAKGWNVITVGGINDHGTADWSDDTMFYVPGQTPDYGSSYHDPGSPHGDRQKPEVVAPAQDITALGLHNNLGTSSGTSLAAPQVAGLVALLMQRNAQLSSQPTAVKAILLASAVHNVEGERRLSDQDGAGAIDAALAGTIAQTRVIDGVTCSGPCWWAIGTQSNYPSPGGSLNEHFRASRGERIRVAIAWWSLADPPPAYPTVADDVLATDFDLYLWGPSGAGVGSSVSWDNNYEIVDFVAPETGTYRIEAHKSSTTTESTNELGIAWVKDATYLPALRNKDGWASEVYVRNDDTTRTASVNYFDAAGNPTPKGSDSCYLAPNQWCWIPVAWDNRIPAGTAGAAVVDSGEALSVLVESQHAGYTMAAAYTGEARPATATYLPAFYKVATLSSLFTVHNPLPAAATVMMAYRDRNGADQGFLVVSLPAGGSRAFDPYNCNDVPPAVCAPGFVDGSVRITANQPVAALATTLWKTDNVPYEAGQYNAPTVGRTTLFAASQYRLCTPDPDGNCSLTSTWTIYSAIVLNNLTATSANVTLRYYRRDTGSLDLTLTDVIPPYGAHGYNTRNGGSLDWTLFRALGAAWDGTVRITTSQAVVVAGVVNTIWASTTAVGTYNLAGPEDGRATIIFPLQAKQASGGNWQRWSAINVMNVGAQTVTVAVNYYNQVGVHVLGPVNRTLAPYQAFGLNTRTSSELSGLPADFLGSAVAQTTAPSLIGVANVIYPDRAAVYDGGGR